MRGREPLRLVRRIPPRRSPRCAHEAPPRPLRRSSRRAAATARRNARRPGAMRRALRSRAARARRADSATYASPTVAAARYSWSAAERYDAFGADPHAARSRSASDSMSSPSGTRAIGQPRGVRCARRSSRAPPSSATETPAASSKSASSVAAQNTGATGMPSTSCSTSAWARALSALLNVISGPPKRPGCCPVVTSTPFCCAARRNRSPAAPRGAIAGSSSASQRESTLAATPRAYAAHSPGVRGIGAHHFGTWPPRAARDSAEPPSGSVTTIGPFPAAGAVLIRVCSFVVRLATHDRPGAIKLLREDEPRELVRQRPGRECER